jgi:hypothetical protein
VRDCSVILLAARCIPLDPGLFFYPTGHAVFETGTHSSSSSS